MDLDETLYGCSLGYSAQVKVRIFDLLKIWLPLTKIEYRGQILVKFWQKLKLFSVMKIDPRWNFQGKSLVLVGFIAPFRRFLANFEVIVLKIFSSENSDPVVQNFI